MRLKIQQRRSQPNGDARVVDPLMRDYGKDSGGVRPFSREMEEIRISEEDLSISGDENGKIYSLDVIGDVGV